MSKSKITTKPYEFSKDTILKITSKVSTFIRECYLVGSKKLVKKFFTNAYILKRVHWEEVRPLFSSWAGEKSDGTNVTPALTTKKVFKEISKMYTVIPCTPILSRVNVSSSDWTLKKVLPLQANGTRYLNRDLNNIIKSKAETMEILINGVWYNTPCRFCKNLLQRVSGECPIVDDQNKLCQPKIILTNDLFVNEKEYEPDGTIPVSTIDVNLKEVATCMKPKK